MTTATATRLQHQHEVLCTLLNGLTQERVSTRPASGKWSLQENVAHLFAYQRVFAARVMRILSEDDPHFEPYIGDDDPLFGEARDQPLSDLLTDLGADRLYLHDLVRALNEAQWTRQATHPRYGTRTLGAWVEFFLLHEAHHLFTIWKLLEETR